jgi:hypothetical protein
MVMYSFVPPFCEAKFCGVPSCFFDKLGCAVGEKSLRNTALSCTVHGVCINMNRESRIQVENLVYNEPTDIIMDLRNS